MKRTAGTGAEAAPPVRLEYRVGARAFECRGGGRHAVGDVDVEEFEPARNRVGTERVGVGPVHHGDVDVLVAVQGGDERGPLRSDLLVLERSDHEDGHLDVRGPYRRRARVEQCRRPAEVRADERVEALGLQMQALVGQARRVARGDLGRRPRLTSSGCRAGVRHALGHPAGGEAVVVDPARVAGRVEVVGGAERRDGRQVRRVRAGHHQLGEPRIGDPHHPDLVVEDPGLRAHGLDDVVAVVVRGQAEQVERAAGAAGAAHLDADGDEAQQRRDDRADHR